MEDAVARRSLQTQALFTVSMTVVAFCLAALVMQSSALQGVLLSLQVIYVFGVFMAAVGLSAAIWQRRLMTLGMAGMLVLTGLAAIAMMAIRPFPPADPLLQRSGAWLSGPLSLSAGWARYAMAAFLLIAGLALPFSLSKKIWPSLIALTVLRATIIFGAFWQVVYLALDGRFDRLFEQGSGLIQLGLAAAIGLSTIALLRGERRWLRALTNADRSVSLARFILPVALLPVIGSFVMRLAAVQGAFPRDVAPFLNVEISSVALLLFGSTALRAIWTERRQRESLDVALESSPVMIHSELGLIEYWPRGCEALFGFTAEEAVGRRAPEILKTEYPLPETEIEAIMRRTGQWAGEVRQTTRDGRKLWIATRVVVDRPNAASDLKLVETMTDVTDLKISNAALRDTTDSFAQVVAGYELGLIDYWPRSGRARFSPQLERLVGLEPGELGDDQSVWAKLINPDDVGRIAAYFVEDARNRAPTRTLTAKVMHKDGQYRDLQGIVRYEYSPTGILERIVGVYMDVTEILHDRMEVAARGARLLELQSELAHTSRLSAMGEMAAALAHELNQPLTAVGNSVGAIEMILRNDERPVDRVMRQRVLRAARHAESQAVRAGEIVRRLREFIARGEADTQVENLGLLVDDALALALPNPGAVGVEVRKSIARRAAMVLADRIQIQQVMVNLIRNAVEAMRDQDGPRKLAITAEVREGMSLIRVADNGCGVAQERVEKLFAPFMSTKSEGMGVGLSICRRIVEAHGGELWFESPDEGGAEFRFTLPIIASEGKNVGT